jgi:midasin
MKNLLEVSLEYMDVEQRRMSASVRSTSTLVQQIMFIISDGQIMEDRRELRQLLARAEANKQVVVLVILDIKSESPVEAPAAPVIDVSKMTSAQRLRHLKAERVARLQRAQKGSILDMQIVQFEDGRVVRRPYLEEFPFPFYIIVKKVSTLPEVLADAMRQWFELFNAR